MSDSIDFSTQVEVNENLNINSQQNDFQAMGTEAPEHNSPFILKSSVSDISKLSCRHKTNIALIVVSIFLVIVIASGILVTLKLMNEIETLSTTVTDLNNKLQSYDTKIGSYDSKISELEKDKQVNEIMFNISNMLVGGLGITNKLPFYCVTDNFVVEKSIVDMSGNCIIDIDTQPTYSSKYLGKGDFSVTDRQLRADLLDLIPKIEDTYEGSKLGKMPDFRDITISFSIKNYDIATYENGELKLKGE